MTKLTPRQAAFVMEYLVDLNATQAAIRAGYAESGAKVEGSRLLANANIDKHIRDLMDARAHRTLISQDKVIRELSRLALFDPSDAYDDAGNLKPIKDMSPDIRAAIASIKHLTDGTLEVRFWDKNSSLDKLMKHLGMFEKDNAQSSGGPRPIRVHLVDSDNKDEI